MKKVLFATAMAVVALAAAPALAQGYVGASTTYSKYDSAGSGDHANWYDVYGGVVAPLSDAYALQFDGDLGWTNSDAATDDTAASGNVHLYRETPNSKLGVFAGAADVGGTIWNAGVEGQAFLPSSNIGGAIGYVKDDEFDVDGWAAQANGAVFVTDNFDLYGNLGYASVDGGNVDGWRGGVGAEYQLASTPISFFGEYSHADISDWDYKTDNFTVGVTYSWSGTLRERNHRGPSLSGLSGLAGLFH
ncbi:MAG: outer membrane protein [Parcubacteria group bacterium]